MMFIGSIRYCYRGLFVSLNLFKMIFFILDYGERRYRRSENVQKDLSTLKKEGRHLSLDFNNKIKHECMTTPNQD